MSSTQHQPPVAVIALGVTALLALFLAAFAWPTSETAPRDVRVAVTGPPPAVAAFEQGTAALGDGALDVTTVSSREAALAAVTDREVYGAFVLAPDGAELLVASAASPAVAELLQQVAGRLETGSGVAVTDTDVVPHPADDPRGAVFRAGALPLVLGGIITGVVVSLQVRGRTRRVTAALVTAAAAGLTLAAMLQYWFGALEGSYWANAGVIALAVAAVALTVVGLRQLLGMAGIGLAALLMMLLGNPLSGVATAPDLLPAGWATLGQLMPPGASGAALRATSFFDGMGAGAPLMVLGAWVLAGAALALLPGRGAPVSTPTAEQPAAVPA